MAGVWTDKDIEMILRQLNERELPFSKYVFSALGEGLHLLGSGGFAKVYEAEKRKNTKQKKKYALKVIGFETAIRESEEAFRTKVEAQQSLEHSCDHIVKIYEYKELRVWIKGDCEVTEVQEVTWDTPAVQPEGHEGELLRLQFILMEKLTPVMNKSGRIRSVYPEQLLREEQELLKLARHIGRAIAKVHSKELLHYDIKPDNIFYHEKKGIYKLGDFGVASVTEHGFAKAPARSYGYVAPEVSEDKCDATADIYSFGMTLYVLLNDLCFPGSKTFRANPHQYEEGYEPPRPRNGSDDLAKIVLRMLRFDPDERYQTTEEVLNELDKLKYGRRVKYQREHKNTSLVMGTAFAVLGAIAWTLTFGAGRTLDFSIPIYLCCGLCGIRALVHLFKKKTGFWSFLIFIAGTVLIVQTGITWWKIVLMILGLVMDLAPGVIGVACLAGNMTYRYAQAAALEVGVYSEYRWLAVLLLSLAVLLIYVHCILEERDEKLAESYLKRNRIWLGGTVAYAMLLIVNWSIHYGAGHRLDPYRAIFGAENIETFLTWNPKMVGICGAVFCLGWMFREWGLIQLEKIGEKLTEMAKQEE